jgi:hypothetical protein
MIDQTDAENSTSQMQRPLIQVAGGIRTTITVSERPQNHALDRAAATGIFLAIHYYRERKVHTKCTMHFQNWGLSFVSHINTYSLTMDWYEPKHEAAIGCLTINGRSWPVFTCFFTLKTVAPIRPVFPGPVPFVKEMYRCHENFFSAFWYARFLIRITASIQFVRVLHRW